MFRVKTAWEGCGNVMDVNEIIERVEKICRANNVERLCLFGSFAKGNAAFTSDVDFVVYGCRDITKLEQDLEQIDTLRKIDVFVYESIKDPFLLEDIKKYERQIY